MGRRFWLGIALLALFLALGLGTAWGMHAIHQPAAADLQAASREALDGNFPEAVAVADRAYRRWQLYRNCTATLADHNPMDDVDALFAEMRIYAQAQEVPHFAACCAQLEVLLKAMAEAHAPTWWCFL